MIDTDEKVDARTVEEDMETRNNMNWFKRLREENKRLREMVEKAVGYGAYDEEYRGEEE